MSYYFILDISVPIDESTAHKTLVENFGSCEADVLTHTHGVTKSEYGR